MKRFLAAVAAFALVAGIAACGTDSGTGPDGTGTLVVQDLTVGTGATAADGDTLNVRYVGTLDNGSQFEAGTFSFRLGSGQVIAGWDQGLVGMKVGGKRRLIIPPGLAYGSVQYGTIPANSTLHFDIDLISINGK